MVKGRRRYAAAGSKKQQFECTLIFLFRGPVIGTNYGPRLGQRRLKRLFALLAWSWPDASPGQKNETKSERWAAQPEGPANPAHFEAGYPGNSMNLAEKLFLNHV